MAVRNRARTDEEPIYLINQALDNFFDLRATPFRAVLKLNHHTHTSRYKEQ